jgi:hypothetical protein
LSGFAGISCARSWPVFSLVSFLDVLAALSEVALAKFVADLMDLLKGITTPASLFTDHADTALSPQALDPYRQPVAGLRDRPHLPARRIVMSKAHFCRR